ncbi:gas vesicle protein GvpJ [Pseudoroseomonas cervicalis]|uniref:gas vesicle protein GvpJ n=1 Tax=Teichococcus cervicalis TaxID=204525 RepID=UPI0022F19BBE|nr:gas vesicle protein GvpJ [Pseudoroseomonas cervicalis]WBV43495.1 gas vesicle protein [Pseudoroseomonas cervicalis]
MSAPPPLPRPPWPGRVEAPQDSLVEVLGRLLEIGVVADGQVELAVAGVELVRLDLRAMLSAVRRPVA